jgi:hypothetical protein
MESTCPCSQTCILSRKSGIQRARCNVGAGLIQRLRLSERDSCGCHQSICTSAPIDHRRDAGLDSIEGIERYDAGRDQMKLGLRDAHDARPAPPNTQPARRSRASGGTHRSFSIEAREIESQNVAIDLVQIGIVELSAYAERVATLEDEHALGPRVGQKDALGRTIDAIESE